MVNTIVPSAHALRNPTRPVQVSHPRKAGPSNASQAAQALLATQTKQRKIELATEVDDFYTYCTEKIADMALHFNKKEHEIRVLLCNTSQLKAHRKPSVRKVVLHQLDLQEEGITKGLKELEANLNDNLEFWRIPLLEHRHQTRTSIRATMKTTQINASNTAECIGNELVDLFEHTGVRVFACFSRRHADDPSHAHSVDSDNTLDFMLQGMDVTSQHFMRNTDADAFNVFSGARQAMKNNATAARADVSCLMTERLRKITKNTKAKMDWVGYKVRIQSKYGVEVVGNVPIPRTRPATWPLETVLAICDGLVNGTIDFMSMTKDQITALAAQHKAVRAAGGTREAGNKSKKTAADSDEDENSNGTDDGDDLDSNSDDEETVMRPALMTPGVGSMLSPVKVMTRPNPSVHPNQCSDSMPLSPRRVLLGHILMEAPPPGSFNPTTYFAVTPISDTALDAVLAAAPVSGPAPISSPTPVSSPAPVLSHTPVSSPAPSGYDPLFPNMPPLPPTFSGMNNCIGWEMGMGMGMGSDDGGMEYRSTMMPVLNMPPSSPTATEKREREEGGEGDTRPVQKRRSKENTAATRGAARYTWRQRAGVARGAHAG
ncbi:hypothetical protein B0H14DRAFT_3700287 [Mycena olivaceomarginata]|nr:hypothetical protein B0H14DRAFT_3700287 [Mycena olivaceomarginata]